MKSKIEIPWKRYALIAELAKRLDPISPQFGKTALQKLVFFLQEIYQIDCGYDFELYSYGPFDSQLLNDLDLIDNWGCVSVNRVNDTFAGYRIRPTETVDSIRKKATEFLDNGKTKQALDDLVSNYGEMTAKNLELRATTVFIASDLQKKDEPSDKEKICYIVGKIKPKFTKQEIEEAAKELIEKGHLKIRS